MQYAMQDAIRNTIEYTFWDIIKKSVKRLGGGMLDQWTKSSSTHNFKK